MKCVFTVLLFILGYHSIAQTYTVEAVPNPKTASNSYVSNPDRILSDSAVAVINTMLETLENKNSTQVAVVAIQSIGDQILFEFAQKLFEEWKIGTASNDNGLLVLFVMDQRKVRFHTGFGIEDQLTDLTGKHIQKQHMVPYFSVGDYSRGMIAGLNQLVLLLSDRQFAVERNENIRSEKRRAIAGCAAFILFVNLVLFGLKRSNGDFSGKSKIRAERRLPYVRNTQESWALWFLIAPIFLAMVAVYFLSFTILFVGLYTIISLSLIASWQRLRRECLKWEIKNEYKTVFDFLKTERWVWIMSAVMFPLPGLFFLPLYNRKIVYYRNHPRNCKSCGSKTEKLDEQTEDAYLSQSQIMEEHLKSIDYDVWKCTACARTEIILFENEESMYALCPKCKTKTYLMEKVVTVSAATYSVSGSKEEHYLCKFCHHQAVAQITSPMLVATTADSSSGGDSSSSSDSGSYGGGDSGGGGSESSW